MYQMEKKNGFFAMRHNCDTFLRFFLLKELFTCGKGIETVAVSGQQVTKNVAYVLPNNMGRQGILKCILRRCS